MTDTPAIPAAEWSESDEGSRSLVASSAGANAELEVPDKGDAFLMVKEHGYQGGMIVSPDGARAAIAVLSRWLAECKPATAGAGHPPARVQWDAEPAGWMALTTTTANWRGFRYRLIGGEWHRMFELTETDLATVGAST